MPCKMEEKCKSLKGSRTSCIDGGMKRLASPFSKNCERDIEQMTKRELGIGGKDPSKQQPKCTSERWACLPVARSRKGFFSLRLQGCEGAAMFIKERKCSV